MANVNNDRDRDYLAGKMTGNVLTGLIAGSATVGSGALTAITSPSGVGVVGFSATTVASAGVVASSAANLAANAIKLAESNDSGGSNLKFDSDKGRLNLIITVEY